MTPRSRSGGPPSVPHICSLRPTAAQLWKPFPGSPGFQGGARRTSRRPQPHWEARQLQTSCLGTPGPDLQSHPSGLCGPWAALEPASMLSPVPHGPSGQAQAAPRLPQPTASGSLQGRANVPPQVPHPPAASGSARPSLFHLKEFSGCSCRKKGNETLGEGPRHHTLGSAPYPDTSGATGRSGDKGGVALGFRMGEGRPWRLPGGMPLTQHEFKCPMPSGHQTRLVLLSTGLRRGWDTGLRGDGWALSGPLESLYWMEGGPHSSPASPGAWSLQELTELLPLGVGVGVPRVVSPGPAPGGLPQGGLR